MSFSVEYVNLVSFVSLSLTPDERNMSLWVSHSGADFGILDRFCLFDTSMSLWPEFVILVILG